MNIIDGKTKWNIIKSDFIYFILGFIIGCLIIFVIDYHDMLSGGEPRHYQIYYYLMTGGICSIISFLFNRIRLYADFLELEEEIEKESEKK